MFFQNASTFFIFLHFFFIFFLLFSSFLFSLNKYLPDRIQKIRRWRQLSRILWHKTGDGITVPQHQTYFEKKC